MLPYKTVWCLINVLHAYSLQTFSLYSLGILFVELLGIRGLTFTEKPNTTCIDFHSRGIERRSSILVAKKIEFVEIGRKPYKINKSCNVYVFYVHKTLNYPASNHGNIINYPFYINEIIQ